MLNKLQPNLLNLLACHLHMQSSEVYTVEYENKTFENINSKESIP